jgi:hypothetical protein
MIHFPRVDGLVSHLILSCLALLASIVLGPSAWAAPTITDLPIRGLQVGGTTTITIQGEELLPEPRLVLPVPILRQELQPGATAERIELEVELSGQVTPGMLPLRVQTASGISNSVVVGVDRLPEQGFDSEISLLPGALHGTVRGAQVMQTSFVGRRGMRITVDVEARRLGSELRPVLRVLDDQGRQLGWNQGLTFLQGDARVTLTLPADGSYHIELHDLLYRAPSPSYFRLKIGSFDFADQVFPPAVQRGESAQVQLLAQDKRPTSMRITPPAEKGEDWFPVVSRSPWFTGIPPGIVLSDHPELVEEGDSDWLELPGVPSAVSGRLVTAGEKDTYSLTVHPGASLRLEVFAQRLGSPIDGVLLVQNEQGQTLARGDDQPGTSDPGLDFQVPDGVSQLRLVVHDLLGQGGDSAIYRLVVRDRVASEFTLAVDQDRLNVASSSGTLLRVTATRHAFSGPIDLELIGLSEDIQVTGARIPTGANQALLAFHSETPLPDLSQLRIQGRAMPSDDQPMVSLATVSSRVEARQQPWHASAVPVVAISQGPLEIRWVLLEEESLPRGGEMAAQLHVERGAEVSGTVRLRLLTTQPMPRKKIKEDNQEKEVDDLDRALRLAEEVTIDSAQSEITAKILVPEDLPDVEWGLLFAAELLGDDGETVTATAYTATRFFTPQTPAASETEEDEEDKEGSEDEQVGEDE